MWQIVRQRPVATAIVVILFGLFFTIEGGRLAALGGSWYYVLAGIGLLGTGALLLAGRREALCLYAVVWLGLALAALLRSGRVRNPLAAPGLILLGLTVTFASFDWFMSVEPEWGSSVYGMMIVSGQLLGALALATLAAILGGRTDAGQRRDLGSLLIAAILLWFYLSFMQFLIVWQENLPHEIPWYVARLSSGWGWAAVLGALAQGAVPFAALICWPVKRSRGGLAAVCLLLLATHLLECWWLILPGVEGGFSWFAPAATLAMGGAGMAVFLWRLDAGRSRHAPKAAALLAQAVRHG